MIDIEKKIDYKFKDKAILALALTHSSYSDKELLNNERLEFLGDKILGFIIAEFLYTKFSDKNEGYLSKFLSYITSREVLLLVAEELSLDKFLKKQSSLDSHFGADTLESLIAAMYLDSQDMEIVKRFILNNWHDHFEKYLDEGCYIHFNPKSFVQEWAQKNKLPIPEYIDMQKEGTEHQPIFHVKVVVRGFDEVFGVGASKKQAQKDASIKFIQNNNLE